MLRRTTKSTALTALSAVLLTATGCGSQGSAGHGHHASHAATARPSHALLSWMGDFCTANEPLSKMPALADIPRPKSTEADRKPLEDFTTKVGTTLLKGKGTLADLRRAPTASARAMVAKEAKDLDDAASSVVSEYSSSAVLLPADELDSVYTLTDVAAAPWDPGDPGLVNYLKGHADLAAAYRQAPACAADRKARHRYLSRLG